MPDHDGQSDDDMGSWWLRVVVVVIVTAGLAAAVNYFAMPAIARAIFSRTPADQLISLEEKREEVTRKASAAIIAGMLGPAEQAPSQSESGKSTAREESGAESGERRAESDASSAGGESEAESGERRAESGESTANEESGGESGDSGAESGERRAENSRSESAEETTDAPPVPDDTPTYEVDRRALNRRLRKPERVRDKVSVVSARGPDGESRGLRILEAHGWFGNYGLHPGDVVRSINGHRVTTRQQAVSLLMGMRKETEFTLTVERHDNVFEIRYHIPPIDH